MQEDSLPAEPQGKPIHLLGFAKVTAIFCTVEIFHLILDYILKCDYVIHQFNAHFSLYILFCLLMMYYLLFILYLFYAREMMLDKKQIWVIYLFEFKMGNKAVEKTCNINNVFHPGPAWIYAWILLGTYLGVELLAHMATLHWAVWRAAQFFPKGCTILNSQQKCLRVPVFPHPS